MISREKLLEMQALIGNLRHTADELHQMSYQFPAVKRNAKRILASVKMLEINLPDVASIFSGTRLDEKRSRTDANNH